LVPPSRSSTWFRSFFFPLDSGNFGPPHPDFFCDSLLLLGTGAPRNLLIPYWRHSPLSFRFFLLFPSREPEGIPPFLCSLPQALRAHATECFVRPRRSGSSPVITFTLFKRDCPFPLTWALARRWVFAFVPRLLAH